jgi:tRNA-uridine 2-sulfurtransferase
MSGGVDSSVSAALLKQAGYDVIGVFIRVWEPFDLAQGKPLKVCTWREDRRDAMRVAATLNIPFITLDLSQEYKRDVVDYMIAEYQAGRTPNPDVMCNRSVKFGAFYEAAIKHGADFVATGHYAVINQAEGKFSLYASADKDKDQTYFLWNLRQEQLPHILFPIGQMTKGDVRQAARKFQLPNAEKKDSQGLCFIGKLDVKKFLKSYIDEIPGAILNESGEIIGKHEGAFFYTLGERHGFTITKKTPTDKPYYIISKDVEKNTITVSQQPEQFAKSNQEISLEDINWIEGEVPDPNGQYSARVRYRAPLQPCQILATPNDRSRTSVKFEVPPQHAPSGQSLVVYDAQGQVCLGGGVITELGGK